MSVFEKYIYGIDGESDIRLTPATRNKAKSVSAAIAVRTEDN